MSVKGSQSTLPEAPLFPFSRDLRCPFDPPALYGQIRREQPVYQVTLWDGRRAWIVAGYTEFRSILADRRFSSDMRSADFPAVTQARVAIDKNERSFITMDPPRHGHFRRMLTKEFTVKRMLELRPQIEKITAELLDEMQRIGPPVDLVASISRRLPALVVCQMLGLSSEDNDLIMRCVAARHGLTQSVDEALEGARLLREYVLQQIALKERAPGEDLLSRLVNEYVKPGVLSRDDLAEMSALLLRGGFDTTANMISLGVLLLLERTDQLQQLQANWGLLDTAVDELLRYLSPTQFVPRRIALEDVEVAGVTIRKGEGVICLIPAVNRDERIFEAADRLDVCRDASNHAAFGYGIHQCLGQPLAKLELQVVFKALFQRFPTLRLAIPQAQVQFKEAQMFGVQELPIAW